MVILTGGNLQVAGDRSNDDIVSGEGVETAMSVGEISRVSLQFIVDIICLLVVYIAGPPYLVQILVKLHGKVMKSGNYCT